MSGARSRNKGHNFERELVQLFRRWFPDLDIKRGLGQTRDGSECADVEMPYVWVEAKRGKRTNIKAALRQAFDAAGASRIPIAICRDDREDATATLNLIDFLPMLESWLKAQSDIKWQADSENRSSKQNHPVLWDSEPEEWVGYE